MSGPPGFEYPSEHDPRRGRHRQGASGGAWTPHVRDTVPNPGPNPVSIPGPTPGPNTGRHALTPAEMNATTNPLPMAGFPIADPPAKHALEGQPAGGRKAIEWPGTDSDDIDAFGFEARDVDPLADTASLGLRKFNIGTVPASVTPPVSSKRAAWFSVAAATGALVSLIAISSALVGPPKSNEQIGALPGVPPYSGEPSFDGDLPVDGLRGGPSGDDQSYDPDGGRTGGRHRAPEPGTGREQVHQPLGPSAGQDAGPPPAPERPSHAAPGHPPRRGGPGSGSGSGSGQGAGSGAPPVAAPPAQDTGAPTVIIARDRSMFSPSEVDGQQIADRSEQYLERVATNPAAAHRMTGGRLHAEGVEGIRQRYASVRCVEVKTIYSDPNRAVTENEVTITKRDGRSITQRRTLHFTPSGNPKITADE